MRLDWSHHEGDDCLRLTGVDARAIAADELARRLPVSASAVVSTRMLPSLRGRYTFDGTALCFVPRFPFVPGTEYTMLVHRSLTEGTTGEAANFDLEDYEALTILCPPLGGEPTTRVVEIHPTASTVPRNLLRVYVHFSAPMSEELAASHVHLRRADTGEAIVGALLPMDPELWDPARRRLTVLFDPARIKRGLVAHREIGYPLETGVAIEVVVDDAYLDADGRPLEAGCSRRYEVGADARAHVDPRQWVLGVPVAGTGDPLVVTFDRPLDHGLLQHCLEVVDAEGNLVAGRTRTSSGERSWEFTPDESWRARPPPDRRSRAGGSRRQLAAPCVRPGPLRRARGARRSPRHEPRLRADLKRADLKRADLKRAREVGAASAVDDHRELRGAHRLTVAHQGRESFLARPRRRRAR